MQSTIEILENVKRNSIRNRDEVFTRLYRYMLRPDLYFVAYQNLYANSGAATKGINEDTADGFSKEKINNIIKTLTDETYLPSPARRTYIQKSNGKMRPLGIPTFTDKLVQEVLRMILEAVYEPVFMDCSHGFRPNRSCHTALVNLKKQFTGARWFVEGDIKGCFDNIDHQVLVNVINSKIKDARLIKLIWKLVKAGYVEDWKFNTTHSGTPQGGIVSPIFANIYLHELDKFVVKMAEEFCRPRTQPHTDEYERITNRLKAVKRKLTTADSEEKSELLKSKKALRAELLKTPCTSQTDKKLRYIRYADDFLISINGSKEDCEEVKQKLSGFISATLKMELSEEKTLITHSNTPARFLGYDIRVRRDNRTIKHGSATRCTKRTLNGTVELSIPLQDKIEKFLFSNRIVKQKNGKIQPAARTPLIRCTELEIVTAYNAELRGICNYYSLASNFHELKFFAYLMEYGCLKTLAAKHKSTTHKMIAKFSDGKGGWCIPYETKNGKKQCYFAKHTDCKSTITLSDQKPVLAAIHSKMGTTFESRLSAHQCELCGTSESKHYEIHHVQKVKNLKGKDHWEKVMIAKRRKTLVVCEACHYTIHGRVFKTEQ